MKYIFSILFLTATVAFAQSFNGGLPIPGLPSSVGAKSMSGSTSITIATDQTAIPISGSITASNLSIGSNSAAAPTSSTLIGYRDGSGNLQPFVGNSSGITVSATQGTSPWVSSRNWVLQGSTDSVGVTGTVSATQGTSPWVTARDWVLQGSIDSVGVTGTVTAGRNWVLQGSTDSVGVTGTVTSTPASATSSSISRASNNVVSATLLSSNSNRKGVFLYNDSTTNCYVKFGSTASASSFTIKLFSTDTYIMDPPIYTGVIDYICEAASGSMEVNEL